MALVPEVVQLDVTALLAEYESGALTVERYISDLLEWIRLRDPTVRAWVHLDPPKILQQAQEADRVPMAARGPLHGVPVGIKDVIYTKGMPTQYNSSIYNADQPELDAASVLMLRNAGAIILGKTATTEFAASTIGPATTNPHNSEHTPGGSSSGSAAAVADFQVPLALGTQTGGSIIRPGSFNGTFALKPTWNAISREGQKFFSINLDTLGWFARSISDLALLAKTFGIADDKPARAFVDGVRGEKFAFIKTMVWDEYAGAGTRVAMDTGVQALRDAGAIVEEIVFPPEFDRLPECQRTVMKGDGFTTFRCEYGRAKNQLASNIVECVETPPSHRDYLEAFDSIATLRPRWDAIASKYAAVIAPSVPDEAPRGLGFTGEQIFNAMWTALHVPVVNIPAFRGQHELPVGLSLVQARYRDEALLQAAEAVANVWMHKKSTDTLQEAQEK